MKHHTIKTFAAGLLAAGAAGWSCLAGAHVSLENQQAQAGSSYKAVFRVGHGCASSATRQIAVDIPNGVRAAKPMPKPGWRLEIQREALAHPYTAHGRTVSEDVVRVTWTAKSGDDMLPSTQYDEFVMVVQLPDKAATVYWPVRQVCEEGKNDWTEIPAPGQKPTILKFPAVRLELTGDKP